MTVRGFICAGHQSDANFVSLLIDRAERAMRTLLTDPCFNVKSVEFLLNLCDDDGNEVGASVGPRGPTIPYTRSKEKKFVSLEECKLSRVIFGTD